MKSLNLSRRQMMLSTGGLGMAAGASLAIGTAPAQAAGSRVTPEALTAGDFDLTTAKDNKLTYARMLGNLDTSKTKYGWYSGLVMSVQDNKKLENLFMMEGFSCARLVPQEDGTFQKLLREVGYYKDLKTGEIMEEWDNPFNGERVRVVPIANDPFNHYIRETYPEPPSYGGLNQEKREPIPFILPWIPRGDVMNMDNHIHLLYPSAMQPDEWPRESPGPMTRVTEHFMYQIDMAELQNAENTSVKTRGTWSRTTPWLPWMLMDQAPGHILYQCFMGSTDNIEDISEDILEYTQKNYPIYMEAPDTWVDPSYSSLENYIRQQEPAPRKDAPPADAG